MYISEVGVEPAEQSDDPGTLLAKGNALQIAGRLGEAIGVYERAVALRPDFPEALNNLGVVLKLTGRAEESLEVFRRAVQLRPSYADAQNNLGALLAAFGEIDLAIEAWRSALAARPDLVSAWVNVGGAFQEAARIDDAIACYRHALSVDPSSESAVHNLLWAIHFHPAYGPAEIWEEHAGWNQRVSSSIRKAFAPHENERSPERRLRIGYVSPDFRGHPVGRFMLPLLAKHNHEQFEVFCYSDVLDPGPMTAKLRRHADLWRETGALADSDLASLIRQDQIDILVDLVMHTAGSRLLAFARKPAPIQACYLAYCSTTGLETMDYRFTDSYFDPPAIDTQYYSEEPIRLRTWLCFEPPENAPPAVAPPPALATGQITFGCLNNYCKISPPTLAAWCELLGRVPGSKLLAHPYQGGHRQQAQESLAAAGIDPRRLEFVGYVEPQQYLETYHQIDIALDPFPYPGGTTTCEALWMGVPVVSLAGRTCISRGGLSILSTVGLPQLVAASPRQYVEIAARLASDLPSLAKMRATMRDRMKASPLMDAHAFARDVESNLRVMWRKWCAGA